MEMHSRPAGVEPAAQEQRGPRAGSPPLANPSRWMPQFWSYPEYVGLQFASTEDVDAAIDLLWSDADLRGLPRVHVGDNTMIVPAVAVSVFREKGCRFTVKGVTSAGDLPNGELSRIRRKG